MEYPLLINIGFTVGIIFLLSYAISFWAIPVIIRTTKKRHLFDNPDDDRKLHSEAIPTLGGIAIFAAFLVSFTLSPWSAAFEGFSFLVAALLILFFVGLKDDLVVLSARTKLLAQLSAAGLVIFGSGIQITNFHGVFGFAEISQWVAVPVSFFTIIVVINAVNLIDGIDGLAGGIGAIASLVFGGIFFYAGEVSMAALSLCLAGALLGFLYYNYSPASIFMGDTGSMLVGFLLAVQAISVIKLSGNVAFSSLFGKASPILPIAILGLPLFDTLRVVLKRVRRKKSIFEAGQDHVHHELLRMGFSHKNASLLLYGKSLIIITIVMGLAALQINVNILLAVVLMTCLLVFPTNGVKRDFLSRFFGFNWLAFRSRKWGIQFDRDKVVELNASQEKEGNEYEGEDMGEYVEKEEVDRIAV